ncbi:MAG: TRAP transporter large permease subunit [Bradyrhizobium sp.]
MVANGQTIATGTAKLGDRTANPSHRRRLVDVLSDTVDQGTTFVAVCATVMFAAVMLMGVFFRYVLNDSLSWSDELATILFGWAIFLFIASAYLHDEHVNLDLLVRRMRGAWRNRATALAEGLAGGYLLALMVSSVQAWEIISKSHTDALQLPLVVHFVVIPISVAIMLVHWIRRNLFDGNPGAQFWKVLVALGFLGLVLLPLGRYFTLAGWAKATVLSIALFGPMLIGVPVALSLGLMATLYVAIAGDLSFMTGALQMFNGINVFVLVAIPLLILSGKLMYAAGIAKRLVEFAVVLVGRIRGGLGASNILASFLFGDISGSAVSDTAAIGSLMIPEMKQRGYRADFCAALQGAAGTLGMTAPLSITVLLYAGATNSSVSRLAAAMIVPSVLLVLSFMALVVWHSHRHKYPTETVAPKLILPRTIRAVPGVFALVLVVGGILGGVFTPAEVGAILLAYILLLAICVYRVAKPKVLYRSCVEAGHISGMTLFMVCTSGFVGFVLSRDLVSVQLAEVISQISINQYYVLAVVSAVFLVLGMFLEPPAMIFGFLPTFLPMLGQANIDIIHWGVLLAINAGIGCILPPVALNLFVSTKLAGVQYGDATRAAMPFILIMIIDLAVVAIVPNLSLFLPHILFAYPLK